MAKLTNTLKYILSITLLIFMVIFVVYNMHSTEIHYPFMGQGQVKVISLIFIGFLIGGGTVFLITLLGRIVKK